MGCRFYVGAWCGIVYVAFAVDVYSRAVVGWSAATHKRTSRVLAALDMARGAATATGAPSDRADPPQRYRIAGRIHRSSQHLDSEVYTWGDGLVGAAAASVTPWTTP